MTTKRDKDTGALPVGPQDRVVFLDIDGVCNSREAVRAGRLVDNDNPDGMLDPVAIGRLNKILFETGAKVVVSSSWRLGRGPEQLQFLLERGGFQGVVHDVTPDIWHSNFTRVRGEEIAAWREEHQHVGPFVILEDDIDDRMPKDHLVHTKFEDGLLDHHVEQAIKILTEPK